PVTDVGDLGRPALIELARAFAAAEPFDDALDLEELFFRITFRVTARQRPFRARAQIAQKIADLRVGTRNGFQLDVAPGIVVDAMQGAVDGFDALANRLALAVELRLKVGDLADGVFVEQPLELSLE